ncbi:MAG: ABC transporter ATP-binding protein [Gammaproteobacteria bacterium]|nr:ABC transporter ATP-binding protein [Gammaproteobacteria bacterium]
MSDTLLDIAGLTVRFGAAAPVVHEVNLGVARGETVVLVGESGSGKSMTALAIMRLLPAAARISAGSIRLGGTELLALPEVRMRDVRGARVGFVFQEPQTALNPVMTVGAQIGEVLARHRGLRGRALNAKVAELLDSVGIPEPARRAREYPHQFSGGMKQRAMVAIAIAGEPELLIADEPTTALDVTLQAQVLELFRAQQRQRHMGMLFITHDLGVAHSVADRVVVMKEGRIVEEGARDAFYAAPRHAYSKALFAALPSAAKRRAEGPGPETAETEVVLAVEDLKVHYPIRRGVFRRVVGAVKAVDGVSLEVRRGRTVALVGESGSGKTTMGRGILRLLPLTAGRVCFEGEDLARLDAAALRRRRAHLQVVFQDPYASMNPRMLVSDIIQEGMLAQHRAMNAAGRLARVDALLAAVGLEPGHKFRYPHEFSGGQRQRICIARALAVDPRLLVCDEPTSALDVSVQAQILALLRELQRERGLSYLFITHNLGVVAYLAHEVAVMYRGRIVEYGSVDRVLGAPAHDYTRELLAAVPSLPADAAAGAAAC